MFGLSKVSPNARSSGQHGVVYLATASGKFATAFECFVTRITPLGIRLALKLMPNLTTAKMFELNRNVEVELKLPGTRGWVRTKGVLVCIAANFVNGQAPMLLDIEFIELSDEEERTLRDSNPNLVVA